jgi:hypothetical protein
VVGLVALMFAGTGIREPVTTTSCRTGSGAALAVVVCWAVAGVDMAAAHAAIDRVIVILIASDLISISFRNLILSLPRSESYVTA